MHTSITILISGRGSNMQSIHQACCAGAIDAKVTHVISNVPDAAGIDYAKSHGIQTSVVNHKDYASRELFDQALITAIEAEGSPKLVLLAGFMRRLTHTFSNHFDGRLLNIHPSLLPRHKGLDTHSRALQASDAWHGCSVHYVNAELDGGPVIARGIVSVQANDSAERLAARVLKAEHKLFPSVVQLCISNRVQCLHNQVFVNNTRLQNPLLYY